MDGDGDVDYVVTNFGLNTKYHASPAKPTLLYYGDFEKTGRMRLVEAEFEDEKLYPVRGKSCSTRAMPFLGKKFDTFKAFASAELGGIYTKQCLTDSHKFSTTTLESGILRNDGQGRFQFTPLPRLAQASPSFGVALTDADGDGHADVLLAQNFHGPQVETGRMDGGVGLLLTGQGNGSFDSVWPKRSGIVVPTDATSMVLTDLNRDGRPDLLIGVNDGPVMAFEHCGAGANQLISVRLQGPRGNPTALGARVTVHLSDGSFQTAEVHASGGYLSQSSAVLAFGLGATGRVKSIAVNWPDGKRTETTETPTAIPIVIVSPDVESN